MLLRGLSEFFFYLENRVLYSESSAKREEMDMAFCSGEKISRVIVAFLTGASYLGAIGAAIDVPNKANGIAQITALIEAQEKLLQESR